MVSRSSEAVPLHRHPLIDAAYRIFGFPRIDDLVNHAQHRRRCILCVPMRKPQSAAAADAADN